MATRRARVQSPGTADRKGDIELPNETTFRDDRLPYDAKQNLWTPMELGQAALDHEAAVEYFKKHPLNGPQRRPVGQAK